MSRLEHITEKQKYSKISILSLLLGILGIAVIFIRAFFYRPWWSEYVARNATVMAGLVGMIIGIAAIIKISVKFTVVTITFFTASFLGFMLSIFLMYHNSKNEESSLNFMPSLFFIIGIIILLFMIVMPIVLKQYLSLGKKSKSGIFANSGIAIGTLLCFFWWGETCSPVQTALRQACGFNLVHIGKAIKIYSEDNQRHYPDPKQWCNLLLKYDQLDKNIFLCQGVKFQWRRQILPWPIPKKPKCHYAMNPDCEPNSPADVVLLFETEDGWNLSGGHELLTTKNHNGFGLNILFNDGRVDFINSKQIINLKWK
jgi:hypothetical protein